MREYFPFFWGTGEPIPVPILFATPVETAPTNLTFKTAF